MGPQKRVLEYPTEILGIKIKDGRARLNWFKKDKGNVIVKDLVCGFKFPGVQGIVDDQWEWCELAEDCRYALIANVGRIQIYCVRFELRFDGWRVQWVRNVGRDARSKSYMARDAALILLGKGGLRDPEQERLRIKIKNQRLRKETERLVARRAELNEKRAHAEITRIQKILKKMEKCKSYRGYGWTYPGMRQAEVLEGEKRLADGWKLKSDGNWHPPSEEEKLRMKKDDQL